MEKEVIVAIIGSCTAVIVSIISIVQSYRTSLNTKDLEKFKHDLESQKISTGIRDAESDKVLLELNKSIQVIQELKDKISFVVNSVGSIDTDAIVKQFQELNDQVAKKYSQCKGIFASREDRASHEAKTISLSLLKLVHKELNNYSLGDALSQHFIDDLSHYRFELNEKQQLLKDCRSERLFQRAGVLQ